MYKNTKTIFMWKKTSAKFLGNFFLSEMKIQSIKIQKKKKIGNFQIIFWQKFFFKFYLVSPALLLFQVNPLEFFHQCFVECKIGVIGISVILNCWFQVFVLMLSEFYSDFLCSSCTASGTDLREWTFLASGIFYLTLLPHIWCMHHNNLLLSRLP